MSHSLHALPAVHSSVHFVAEHSPAKHPPAQVSLIPQWVRTFHASHRDGDPGQSEDEGGGEVAASAPPVGGGFGGFTGGAVSS